MSKRLLAHDRVPRAGERNDITHVAWRMDKFTEVILWVRDHKKPVMALKAPIQKALLLGRSFSRLERALGWLESFLSLEVTTAYVAHARGLVGFLSSIAS